MSERLQDRLTWQSERRPEACAIVFDGNETTYGQLEEGSNRLAAALRAAGCRRGDRVGLLLPKSPQALIGMFAALKADCTYVPLDTASPPARLARILQSCESRCILAVRSTAGLLAEILPELSVAESPRIGWMDGGPSGDLAIPGAFSWNDVCRLPASTPGSWNTGADPAHILFTSGSTGLPKGVVITHSNVIHFVDWAVRYFGIEPSDRISGHPPLHFDLSTFDIHGTIAVGAQIHLLRPEISLLPHRLADFIREAELTQWFSVPSILNHMAKLDVVRQDDFPALRRLLWCGEKIPTPALIHWMRRLPHVAFFNLYGPTEATIASSYYRVPQCPEDPAAEVPIGKACDGEQLLVLDERLEPVAPGKVGDLYIGGVGLSPGYWRDPEKTSQVFIHDRVAADTDERIYRTGDLARVGDDGLVYLLGRSDSQIKTRGYRIELGEIEAALHTLPGLRDAAVVAVGSDGFEGLSICCGYVPESSTEVSPLTLKRDLARILPAYMLPARWIALEHMPRNGNGKTDRAWLKRQFSTQ